MLTRSLVLALAVTSTVALEASAGPARKVPMIQATMEASVLFGPGREPLPGAPPFRPNLEVALAFEAAPPKGMAVRLWLVPLAAKAGAAPSTVRGARALRHAVLEAQPQALRLRADWPVSAEAEAWRAAVEFRVGGRLRGHASAPVQARFLPAAPPRGGRPGEEN